MPSYSRDNIVLITYPFSDLSGAKVRPAVVVSAPHVSADLLVVPLTSRADDLLPGEFILADWSAAGLNVPSSVKRGVYTIHPRLVIKSVGTLQATDSQHLRRSLRGWLGLDQ